ncbi:hypothetical protein JCM8547_006547 [Rhodosporidiobolus lusitaniae]
MSTRAAPLKPPARPSPAPPLASDPVDVLYRDSRTMVLNKPAGVALQGQIGSPPHRRWQQLISALRNLDGCSDARPVHRLDKSTSGALLFALSSSSAKQLAQQLKQHDLKRTYLAVVHGQLKPGYEGDIDARLRMDDDRVRLAEGGGEGVEARTRWRCLSVAPHFSLLELKPETGRKHQLRVHCADVLRAPIVGDFKISPSSPHASALSDLSLPLNTVLLHASSLSYYSWLKSGKRITITASAAPPPSFLRFCRAHKLALPVVEEP